MKNALAFFLVLLLALMLLAAAIVIPQAQRLNMPWDLATLRQPNELKHRVVAILSSLNEHAPATADMQPIANTVQQPLGVNTFFEQEVDEATIRREMQMIRDAGFTWIRQQFAWYEIERPAKGQYMDSASARSSWEKYDRIVNLAQEYGLNVLARVDTVPDWARPEGSTFTHPPTNHDDYADFVHALATRYAGKLHYYQLWNEPNLTFEWGNENVSASDFVPLLKAGYTAIKSADPSATVVAPALAPTRDVTPDNRNEMIYLQDMYNAGAKDYFDVMSTMDYGLTSGPDDRRLDPTRWVNFSRPQLLRQVMAENGDGGKPIWFSEMAWNALPDPWPVEPVYGRTTLDQQARYTVRGLQRVRDEWPWAGVSFLWFFRRPDEHEKDQQWYYFRLADPDFSTMPVYDAVKAAEPSLRVLRRGYQSPAHWAVTPEGDWQTMPSSSTAPALYSSKEGSSLSFDFAGTDLSLIASGPGRLYVDLPGTRLPVDSAGRAYIDLPAEPAQIALASGLSDGTHTATLRLGEGEATLSSLIVDRQQSFPASLLWAAAIFCGVWAIAWRVRR